MAKKPKLQSAGSFGGKNYFYTSAGELVDEGGAVQEAGFVKRVGPALDPYSPEYGVKAAKPKREKKPKAPKQPRQQQDELEEDSDRGLFGEIFANAFPAFASKRGKGRSKSKSEQAKDQQETNLQLDFTNTLLKDSNFLIRQSLTNQDKIVSLLDKILSTLQGMGGGISLPNIPRPSGNKGGKKVPPKKPGGRRGLFAAGALAAGAGAVLGAEYISDVAKGEGKQNLVSNTPPVAGMGSNTPSASTVAASAGQSSITPAIATAASAEPDANKQEMVFEADKLIFESDELEFQADKIIIDAKNLGQTTTSVESVAARAPNTPSGSTNALSQIKGGTSQASAASAAGTGASGLVASAISPGGNLGEETGKIVGNALAGLGGNKMSVPGVVSNDITAKDLPKGANALLNLIAGKESGGAYNVLNGGERFELNGGHPGRVGAGGSSTAAGRYQFVKGTWEFAAKGAGVDPNDFSPENQDRAAWWLVSRNYKRSTGRDLSVDITDPSRAGDILRAQTDWEASGVPSLPPSALTNLIAASQAAPEGVPTVPSALIPRAPTEADITRATPANQRVPVQDFGGERPLNNPATPSLVPPSSLPAPVSQMMRNPFLSNASAAPRAFPPIRDRLSSPNPEPVDPSERHMDTIINAFKKYDAMGRLPREAGF